MAQDKSQQKPPQKKKKKKLPPVDNEVSVQGNKVNRAKRKKMEVEEAPVSIPDDNIAMEEKQKNKAKKHKKQQKTQQTETTKQISVPPDDPDGNEDLSPEERRVLERKLKKMLKKEEKKRLKAEGITLPKTKKPSPGPSAAKQALDYLTCWADNRADWRFQKIRQTWLLQHMFDSEQVPDDKFSVLLQYIEGLRGGARDTTVQKALDLVQDSGQDNVDVHKRAQRAREVIQMLA
nr:uncharacterized protein C7orf50 homolog isoform X2 [Doryrhamphus excisus]